MIIWAIAGLVLSFVALRALRAESVPWIFAIPIALVPLGAAAFIGLYGFIAGAIFTSVLWKMDIGVLFSKE